MDIKTAHTLLEIVARQEAALVFPRFTNEDAYQIGTAIKQAADQAGRKVVISIFRGEDNLFFHAMDSIKPINLNWLNRKIRTVRMYRCSSLCVGLRQTCSGGTFEGSGLDPAQYAAVGGCFPVVLSGCGFVGTIAVSGMEQQEDHQTVVDAVGKHLGVEVESVLPCYNG